MSSSLNGSATALSSRWTTRSLPQDPGDALAFELLAWNDANTPDELPGYWVKGNLSTMRFCSELDGSVVILPANLAFPFDNYICRSPNRSESHHALLTKAYQKNKIEIMQFISLPSSGGGKRQAVLATTVLYIVTGLLAIASLAL